ncbi:protein AAR2 homolog [Triticum dicoccoides]|uniref:protein AAR2 homolog n=1 Tax=Triticum dicoccoides TaxID=85692 RepID=UPI001890B998|nr:protein AAR2 homolog [Triticum dicoccoides]
MDPEAATELARKGVTLLLLDVPQHTLLGLDTQVFSVSPRFRGIKMVPPGPHFLHYCSPSRAKRFNNHEILAEDVRDWDIASDRGQGQRAQGDRRGLLRPDGSRALQLLRGRLHREAPRPRHTDYCPGDCDAGGPRGGGARRHRSEVTEVEDDATVRSSSRWRTSTLCTYI